MNRTALARTGTLAIMLLVVVAAVAGRLVGPGSNPGLIDAQEVAPDATATRAAELQELADLRTRVASLEAACAEAACAAAGTPVVTPVPPLPMGQTVPYPGDWSVTVTGATLRPSVEDLPGQGPFVQVEVEVTN